MPITHFPVSLFMLQNYKEEISSERIANPKIIDNIFPSPRLMKKFYLIHHPWILLPWFSQRESDIKPDNKKRDVKTKTNTGINC